MYINYFKVSFNIFNLVLEKKSSTLSRCWHIVKDGTVSQLSDSCNSFETGFTLGYQI